MGKGMEIQAYDDKIHVTPSDDEEWETLIAMYTRVNVDPEVVGNTYVFSKEDWHKIIKASMKV